MSQAIYNEIEPSAVAWMRNLIAQGHIAPGVVDDRSIADLKPDDIVGNQAHFFAGIGGWSHALRLAGWPDDVPVWTGSCPCQPFSSAGRRKGFDDARHLWPVWYALIRERKPAVVFGEQVASPDGLAWLDTVSTDLEAADYAFAAADLCAAGIGAPHIRQRLYFVAVANGERRERLGVQLRERRSQQTLLEAGRSGALSVVADADGTRFGTRRAGEARDGRDETRLEPAGLRDARVNGRWGNAEWIPCRDGKWRPIEPGTFPVANGVSGRMGRLRGYGNAIVPQVASTFVKAVMEYLL